MPTPRPRRPAAAAAALFLAAGLTAGLAGCTVTGSPDSAAVASPAAGPGGPVAVVDGERITQPEFDRRMATVAADGDVAAAMATQPGVSVRLRADVLAQMVDARLVAAAAPALGVQVTEADVTAYVDRIAAEQLGGGPGAWAAFLAEQGYPEEEILAQLGEDLLRERVEDRVRAADVSDEQVAQAFAEGWQDRVRVAHVLVATREEADAVLADLRAGADFATLARERSTDRASATAGGDLGPWTEQQYVAPFDQAVESADGPGLLDPVASPFGWHVIEVRAPATLTEVVGPITEQLVEQQQDAGFLEWVAGLRQGAAVDVRDDLGTWDGAAGRVTTP